MKMIVFATEKLLQIGHCSTYKDGQECPSYLRIRSPLRIENNTIKERYSGPPGQRAFSRCRFHSKEPCSQMICTQTSLKVISDRCALVGGRMATNRNKPSSTFNPHRATFAGRLHEIPDNVSFEEARLVEPISVVYNGVWGTDGGVKPHDYVAVVGYGPIGMYGILGSDGSACYFATPLQLMSRHIVDFTQVITHRFPLEKIEEALKLGASQSASSKIVLRP